MEAEKLLKRYEKAEARRLKYYNLLRTGYELAMPERNNYSGNQEGQSKTEKVYDSTGMSAVNSFSNTMMSTITPPFTRWFELGAGELIPEDNKEAINEKLTKINQIIHAILNASNFYSAAGEMYYELCAGTGALLVLEEDDIDHPISFTSVQSSDLALEEGRRGEIGAVFRTYCLPSRLISETWKDAKDFKPDEEREVVLIEATYLDYKNKEWIYNVIDKTEKKIIVERKYTENPFIVLRWSKISNEVFGRGPLLQALPDLKMLNKERELAIKTNELNAFGIWTIVDDGVIDTANIKFTPGAGIVVGRNAGTNGPTIAALPQSGNPALLENDMMRLQMSIKNIMYDNRLPTDDSGVRSATEIMARMKFLQSDIGSAFGRIMSEYIYPLVRRVVGILSRQGLIKIPEIVINNKKIKTDNVDKLLIGINILSPIARMQNTEDVQTAVQAVQTMMSLDPSGGQITMATVDLEKLFKWVADKLGVPPQFTRSEVERVNFKAEQAQAQINQQIVQTQIQGINQ